MSEGRAWSDIKPSWFRTATEDELREFVKALDNNKIPVGSKLDELKLAFDKECNRRCGQSNEEINGGEWI